MPPQFPNLREPNRKGRITAFLWIKKHAWHKVTLLLKSQHGNNIFKKYLYEVHEYCVDSNSIPQYLSAIFCYYIPTILLTKFRSSTLVSK